MITLRTPHLVRELSHYSGGLFTADMLRGEGNLLVIKCSKEMILSAKMLRELKVYLIPLDTDGVSTYGLVTALFDDPDEPLTIRSPLLDDEMAYGIFNLLNLPEFSVHFFDEHNRELLAYQATNERASEFASMRKNLHLASSLYIPTTKIDDQLMSRFSNRTPEDDAQAFRIELKNAIFEDDFLIWDARPEYNSYHGQKHPMFTSLERKDPGVYSELDIVYSLLRIFLSDQIFLNPVRTDTDKEFVDVMVATDENILLIQAKDSPNTEHALRRPIERKVSTVLKHLRKATTQIRGSISHVTSIDHLTLRCKDLTHTIAINDLDITALIIVKELFSTEYKSYSELAFDIFDDTGIPCFIHDYTEFHEFTYYRRTEEQFFSALDDVFRFAVENGEFPRSRFWL